LAVLFSAGCALVAWQVGRAVVVGIGGPGASTGVTREWQLVLGVRLLGMLVGVLLASVTWSLGGNGRGPMLSPAICASRR